MKKIMMLLLVAALMLGVSGNAMAYFDQGDLIRVVYSQINGTGTEFATDLGNYSNLTDPSKLTGSVNINTSNFSAAAVGATDFSNVRVAYYIFSNTLNGGNGAAWTSGALTNSGIAFPTSFVQFQNGTIPDFLLWQSKGTISATNPQADASSFYNNAELGAAQPIGSMGGYLNTNGHTGASTLLTALNTPGGFVQQYLYYYGSNPDIGGQGTVVAMLTTNADGSTTLSAVPIPAAAYLFGSGLLSMFGLRRKMAA